MFGLGRQALYEGFPCSFCSYAIFRPHPEPTKYSPGGSTGGETALFAYGGSCVGVGTDVAGSVRLPADYPGVYKAKGTFEWKVVKVENGEQHEYATQEGLAPAQSTMARTLKDLEMFRKEIMNVSLWECDRSFLPIPWRTIDLNKVQPRWGMWDDGVVLPSSACRCPLVIVLYTLRRQRHIVIQLLLPVHMRASKSPTSSLLTESNDLA